MLRHLALRLSQNPSHCHYHPTAVAPVLEIAPLRPASPTFPMLSHPQHNTSGNRSRSWPRPSRLWNGIAPNASKHSSLRLSLHQPMLRHQIFRLECHLPRALHLLLDLDSASSDRAAPWIFGSA